MRHTSALIELDIHRSVVSIEDRQWGHFVREHPDATCFHEPAWAGLLAECYRFTALAVVHRDDAGEIIGGLPLLQVRRPSGRRDWVCLPFSDECGPLVTSACSRAEVVATADELRSAHGVAALEIRDAVELPGGSGNDVGVTHLLDLSGSRSPLAAARPSVRRNLKKAHRAGVRIRHATSEQDMLAFYRLHQQTRHRQGVPVQPLRYFRLLWRRLIEPGRGFVLLAEVSGDVAAGAVYLLGARGVTYKYGASEERHWAVRPNNAVMAEAITWATERGYAEFDFGRTEVTNEGLVRFKDSWGAASRPLIYTRSGPPAPSLGRQRSTAALAAIIRRSPPVVCRGLGELLYRFAA